jgi:transposase
MHYIGIDVHCQFCEGGFIDHLGRPGGRFKVPTCIPALTDAIERVPRPRKLVIEEGPLADWLARHLSPTVDEMVVCDPYRNALIAKDGDKSDAIDWQKLADLCRGGYVRAVHQPQSLARSLLKQHVQLYHDRVRHRVSESHKIIWRVRRLGVFVTESDLKDDLKREAMISALPEDAIIRDDVKLLLKGYDVASEQVHELRRRMVELGKRHAMARAFCELPGVNWVRATTFFAVVDTPFRFASKQKLWKYAGIGLERGQSGNGPVRLTVPRRCNRVLLTVPRRCNRVLKCVVLGAAKSAAAAKNNVFADQYQRWRDEMNCSPRIARRNTARSLATTMWGMWKSGSVFDRRMLACELAAEIA